MNVILPAFGMWRQPMLKLTIKPLLILTCAIALIACEKKDNNLTETTNMTAKPYICALEKDHNPPLDPEADKYFKEAVALEKTNGWEDWPKIVHLYEKAIEKNHWKAMYNLAGHYKTGEYGRNDEVDHPTAVKKDTDKMVALHYQMVKLEVPLGYYTFAMDINNGYVRDADKKSAALYFGKAVELGYPLALVSRGNYYAFSLPRGEQRYDIAEQYFKCAGKQDNTKALIEVADFYKIAKENMPLSVYYYQKAASLGDLTAMMVMKYVFDNKSDLVDRFGYEPDQNLVELYTDLYYQLDKNADLKFPDLMKDHPLPRHPTQGYDADNPDVRPTD